MAGLEASPEAIESIRVELGLDKPIVTQFVIYVTDIFPWRPRAVLFLGRDVTELIGEALPRTAYSSRWSRSRLHGRHWRPQRASCPQSGRIPGSTVLARGTALVGVSTPPFFAGLLGDTRVFVLRAGGSRRSAPGTWKHLVLPGFTLGLFSTGLRDAPDPLGDAGRSERGLHPYGSSERVSRSERRCTSTRCATPRYRS